MVTVADIYWPAAAVVGLIVVQRLAELRHARRNAERLLAQGAREVGADHYPLIVAIHTGFIAGLGLEPILFGARPPVWWMLPLMIFAAAQLLRYWSVNTLGPRWTTRIYVLPEAPLIREGPYRFLKHPNYTAVMLEFISLPLLLGAYGTAALFVPLNAVVLYGVRIPTEEQALAELPEKGVSRHE